MKKSMLLCRLRSSLCGKAMGVFDWVLIASLFGFGVVFALDGNDLFKHHIYYKFQAIPTLFLVCIMWATAFFQAACLIFSKHDLLIGFARILMGGMWLLIFAAFYAAYPPLNTGMVIPLIFALVALVSGREQMLCDYRREACLCLLNGKAKNECCK